MLEYGLPALAAVWAIGLVGYLAWGSRRFDRMKAQFEAENRSNEVAASPEANAVIVKRVFTPPPGRVVLDEVIVTRTGRTPFYRRTQAKRAHTASANH